MSVRIRGLNQSVRNTNDAISMIQTAEGALTEVTNMLQRMRELAEFESQVKTALVESPNHKNIVFTRNGNELSVRDSEARSIDPGTALEYWHFTEDALPDDSPPNFSIAI